jgi:hypothetical protein
MRWSLVLSAFIAVQSALSFVCVALVIPLQSDELERREPARRKSSTAQFKLPSPQYRKIATEHPFAYHVQGLTSAGKLTDKATVRKEKLEKGKERDYGAPKLKNTPGLHADHVFEAQMLSHHLKEHGIEFNKMKPGLQNKIKGILNGPKNMALIPGSINQSKGQLIKQGMEGKAINRKKVRDDYALQSYGTARKTAKKLDLALKEHPGYVAAVNGNTLKKKLRTTFLDAGLVPGSHVPKLKKSSSKQPTTRPSTPPAGPSTGTSSTNQGDGKKRQISLSPGKSSGSPPKARQRT